MAGAAGAYGGPIRLRADFDPETQMRLVQAVMPNPGAGAALIPDPDTHPPTQAEINDMKEIITRYRDYFFLKVFKTPGHMEYPFQNEHYGHMKMLKLFRNRTHGLGAGGAAGVLNEENTKLAIECRKLILSFFSICQTTHYLQIRNTGIQNYPTGWDQGGNNTQGGPVGNANGANGQGAYKYAIPMQSIGSYQLHQIPESMKELSFSTLVQFFEKLNFLNLFACQNDLHMGNVLYRPQFNEINIIDFGLQFESYETPPQIADIQANGMANNRWPNSMRMVFIGLNIADAQAAIDLNNAAFNPGSGINENILRRVNYVYGSIIHRHQQLIRPDGTFIAKNIGGNYFLLGNPYYRVVLDDTLAENDLKYYLLLGLQELEQFRLAAAGDEQRFFSVLNLTNDLNYIAPCLYALCHETRTGGAGGLERPVGAPLEVLYGDFNKKPMFKLPFLVRCIMIMCLHPNPVIQPMPRNITRLFRKILKEPFHSIKFKWNYPAAAPGGQDNARQLAILENRIEGDLKYNINELLELNPPTRATIEILYPNGDESAVILMNYTIMIFILNRLLTNGGIIQDMVNYPEFWHYTTFRYRLANNYNIFNRTPGDPQTFNRFLNFRDTERNVLYTIKELFKIHGEHYLLKDQIKALPNDTNAWAAVPGILSPNAVDAKLGL